MLNVPNSSPIAGRDAARGAKIPRADLREPHAKMREVPARRSLVARVSRTNTRGTVTAKDFFRKQIDSKGRCNKVATVSPKQKIKQSNYETST
ncbi:MAG: hypothetical protein EPO07_01030 [Verrucomicrobia bacterium]|nr:MAG: hypothetical protein EPO07_01030 [Verrucomicrobiota bacterium]